MKIKFIESHFIDIKLNLWFPLFSTIFLILLYPIFTTGAYWIWLKYKKIQYDLKNKVEEKQLLTLEKSINLRLELKNKEMEYDKLFEKKEEELNILKKENRELYKQIKNENSTIDELNQLKDENQKLRKELKENEQKRENEEFEDSFDLNDDEKQISLEEQSDFDKILFNDKIHLVLSQIKDKIKVSTPLKEIFQIAHSKLGDSSYEIQDLFYKNKLVHKKMTFTIKGKKLLLYFLNSDEVIVEEINFEEINFDDLRVNDDEIIPKFFKSIDKSDKSKIVQDRAPLIFDQLSDYEKEYLFNSKIVNEKGEFTGVGLEKYNQYAKTGNSSK